MFAIRFCVCVLTFIGMVQKQGWVRLLVPYNNKEHWIVPAVSFSLPHTRFKKVPVCSRMSLMRQYKSLVLLNLDPWVQIFLIFCVQNWKACREHSCWAPKYEGCLTTKHRCDWVLRCTRYFFKERRFHLKK